MHRKDLLLVIYRWWHEGWCNGWWEQMKRGLGFISSIYINRKKSYMQSTCCTFPLMQEAVTCYSGQAPTSPLFISNGGLEIHQNIIQIQKRFRRRRRHLSQWWIGLKRMMSTGHTPADTPLTDGMYSWSDYDPESESAFALYANHFLSQQRGAVGSCHLDDSSNKLSLPSFWCAALCRRPVRDNFFSDLAFRNFCPG